MRHSMLWLGVSTLLFALACGGSAPEPEDTGTEVVAGAPARVSAPPKKKAAAAANGSAAAAPAVEGKTKVDVSHGGLSVTTKKGTEIELKPGLFGGLSIQNDKTDVQIGGLKKKKKTDDEETEKKEIFPGMSDPEDDL